MPNDQMYKLNTELLESVLQFVVRAITPDLFDIGKDHPAPEAEIRAALQNGGGFIQLREDGKNAFLVITHRNGRLLVHKARIRAVVHNSTAVSGLWEDSALIDDRRRLVGLDATGLLVELSEESSAESLENICSYRWLDEVPVPEDPPRVKVTVLDMKYIDVHTFLEGLEARDLAPAA
jgi:hypothetical protein